MPDRPPIDLRSDTVTKPTPDMRRAMANAEVGDDVFGDDPTVNRLQERVAELLGKESAIFVPSGSMANQASIRSQTHHGDEIICHQDSHIYHYEAGGPASLSGCSLRLLTGERGLFEADQVRAAIRPPDSHFPQTRLVVVENTHNRGGGSIWPVEQVRDVHAVAREHGLSMHLDGARLMNACVATGRRPTDYTRYFDSVSTCFSKGLGAPVGSAVAGSKELIRRVHRFRKMFGGAMRQAGIIAAGALYALEHHIDRLADDHANARRLASAIADMPGLSIDPASVETNILYFDVDESVGTAKALCDRLRADGVWVLPVAPQRIRAVTHLDVSASDIDRAISILSSMMKSTLATA
ncbi:MAG: low-specificity L-threonine aldolase [Phycisphaerales bacterium]|nr:low-specificity L-threonine aldolase [Phycisphaerales bacterium]